MKFQEGRQAIRGHAGRQIVDPRIYQPTQVVIRPGYQPGQAEGNQHGRAHGKAQLDLSHLAEEMGIEDMAETVTRLDKKADSMLGILHNTIQNEIVNDLKPTLQSFESKMEYLSQAVQNLQAGMQALNDQVKVEQQILHEFVSSKCDPRIYDQSFRILQNSLQGVMEDVKQFKSDQSNALKAILQAIVQNNQAMSVLQHGVTATFNSCSTCSVAGSQSQMGSLEVKIDEGARKIMSLVSLVPQNVRRAMRDDLDSQANAVIQHWSQGNDEIKQYLLDLATKMMNYRDEYLKRIVEQNKKMEVIKKTVTQTTQVMASAAAGTQQAARQIASAQRSLDSSSTCGGKQTKGK